MAVPSLQAVPRPCAVGGGMLVHLGALLAVETLLLCLALSSLGDPLRERRLDAQQAAFLEELRYGSRQAQQRGQRVGICAGQAGRCAGLNAWDRGRVVWLDLDGNGELDAGEPVLREGPGWPPGDSLFAASGAGRLAFGTDGRIVALPAAVHTWTLRSDGQEAVRCIRVGNGVHAQAQRREGACA